jgi:hypothetical protein
MNIYLDTLQSLDDATYKVDVAFDDDGNGTAGFSVVGKDSAAYRDAAHRMRVASIKRAAVKSQRIDTKTEQGAETLDALVQSNELELAVAATVGWYGFSDKGAPAAFTADAIRRAYTVRPTWREKVTAALENETNFLPPSSTTSVPSPGSTSA